MQGAGTGTGAVRPASGAKQTDRLAKRSRTTAAALALGTACRAQPPTQTDCAQTHAYLIAWILSQSALL